MRESESESESERERERERERNRNITSRCLIPLEYIQHWKNKSYI